MLYEVITAQESYARGGIVAFANGGEPQDWKSSLENISQERNNFV